MRTELYLDRRFSKCTCSYVTLAMERRYSEEQPPPDYSEVVRTAMEDADNFDEPADVRDTDLETQPANNHDQTPAEVEATNQLDNSLQTTLAYLKNPSRYQGRHIASNSFKGFLDVVHKQEGPSLGFDRKITYKVILFIYYLTHSVYSIGAISIRCNNYAYYLVYFFIAVTGLFFEVVVIVAGILESKHQSSHIRGESLPPEISATEQCNYYCKAKGIFIDCVLLSLGELLIYPIIICNLYGFIEERTWQFNDAVSGLNFIFFVYSLLMDFIFTKILVIHRVKTIIKATYTQYNVLVRPSKPLEWKISYYLILLLAIATALTHWSMIEILATRIHFDNFTTEKDNVDGHSLNTGNYRMTPFTGYMIGFSLCFPIFSVAVFVLLNKLWFYEVYSAIHQSTITRMSESNTLKLSRNIKMFAFIRDPLALLTVIVLMTLFIIFSVGAYLPDHDDSHYADLKIIIEEQGACFILLFLISNLQAAIIFVIMLLTITTMLPCVLCIVCACLYSRHSDRTVTNTT